MPRANEHSFHSLQLRHFTWIYTYIRFIFVGYINLPWKRCRSPLSISTSWIVTSSSKTIPSEYIIAFPLQQCLFERATCYVALLRDKSLNIDCMTKQAMHVYRNIEGRSYNHWCSGKSISITHYECVFVALGIQRAIHTRHIVTCGLPRLYSIFHII